MQPPSLSLLAGAAALSLSLPGAAAATLPRTRTTLTVRHDNNTGAGAGNGTGPAAETLVLIMPSAASCAGRGDECATAAVAAPYLAASMRRYGVATGYEQAGILSLIAYESVELQYRVNQNAEQRALGRGTANEQGGEFNVEYANTFPELAKLNLSTSNVLNYVTADKYNFATGSWYYSSQDSCADARAMAKNGSTAWEWFQEYMAGCDGLALASVPDQLASRIGYWNAALNAFHISNDTTNQVS